MNRPYHGPPARKHTGKRLWARLGWCAALLWMGGIFWLSSVPGDQLPLPQFLFSDKLAHLITYGVLGALIALRAGLMATVRTVVPLPIDTATDQSVESSSRIEQSPHPHHSSTLTPLTKGGWIAPAVGIAYAVLDELHQSFVPNRTLSFGDFTADVIGILAGFWLARRWDAARMRRASFQEAMNGR